MALVLVASAWRRHAAAGPGQRVRRVGLDTRLWSGLLCFAGSSIVLFGTLWNFAGVQAHVAYIVGPAAGPFRMFTRDARGIVDTASATLAVFPVAMGVIGTVLALAGMAVAIRRAAEFTLLWLLCVPVLSYALTFILIVGYVYDRFLLGAIFIAALFAAVAVEAIAALIPFRRAAAVTRGGLVLAALLPAVVLNQSVIRDSRIEAEGVLSALADDPSVLGVGAPMYLPNLHPFRSVTERGPLSEAVITDAAAAVVVINEQWMRRPGQPPRTIWVRDLTSAGYRNNWTSAPTTGSRWNGVFLQPWQLVDPIHTNLAKINPSLSVWIKEDTGPSERE